MFKKFINHSEQNQVEMNDSVLRDIIPSNEVSNSKKPQNKRCSNVCKVLIFIFILGFIAIGVVLLTLIVTYSGKSFMNFIVRTSDEKLSPSINKTRVLTFHQGNQTETWKEITDSQPLRIYENKHISTNPESMKFYSSANTIVNEQTTIPNRQSTISSSIIKQNQEYVQTSLKHERTTANIFTHKIRTIPLTSQIDLQSSTSKTINKYQNIEENDDMDDLFFS